MDASSEKSGSNVIKMPEREHAEGRVYGGLTAEQRTAARRERLLDAGLEVFGTEGYKNATVRSVIRTSGLGERYFYENFEDLDDLMVAVAQRIHEEVMREALLAVAGAGEDPVDQIRTGLESFIRAMTRDPRKARIKLLEMSGAGEKVRNRRREGMNEMAALIAFRAPDAAKSATSLDPQLIALGLVGAVNELLIEWFVGEIDGDIDRLVNHCTALFEGTLRLAFENAEANNSGGNE